MVYQGSKEKLAKDIVPVLQRIIKENDIKTYIEPFCGSAAIVDKIICPERIASDINPYLISLLKYAQSDPTLSIFPLDCPKEHYAEIRECFKKDCFDEYSMAYVAGIGYFASYGGRFFDGGYGKDPSGKRNIYAERVKNMKEQALHLKDINFFCRDYKEYRGEDYENCLFYIDWPYVGTKQYGRFPLRHDDELYNWARELGKRNHVIISEYTMPEDFKEIWHKERKVCQRSDRVKADSAVEKLFTI